MLSRQHHAGSLNIRSLYVRNLSDKLPKEDLKRNLYMLFATYGVILDVVALKTMKMRGQAHIVFRDLDASTQAMRALQGFTFFGKDMVRLKPFKRLRME
jgi:U2 small nuclear ribonucleoprotein B''